MSEDRGRRIDMSSSAIDRRLREVASLYRLGLSIAAARRIGRRSDDRCSATGDAPPRSEPPRET